MQRVLRRFRIPALVGIAVIVAALVLGCREDAPTFASAVVEPPSRMPEVNLVAGDGQPFRLSDQQGKVVVVYVGYTFCPDLCPLAMSTLANAYDRLPAEVRDGVQVVMITADPARDTPEVMGKYVNYFDPAFTGVSGDPATVLETLASWGIHPERSATGTNGSYFVSHPTRMYVFNRDGLLRLQIAHDLEPESVASDLELVWREGND
jgi:protein SCO1/2